MCVCVCVKCNVLRSFTFVGLKLFRNYSFNQ